jgi:hypothetical protein
MKIHEVRDYAAEVRGDGFQSKADCFGCIDRPEALLFEE